MIRLKKDRKQTIIILPDRPLLAQNADICAGAIEFVGMFPLSIQIQPETNDAESIPTLTRVIFAGAFKG